MSVPCPPLPRQDEWHCPPGDVANVMGLQLLLLPIHLGPMEQLLNERVKRVGENIWFSHQGPGASLGPCPRRLGRCASWARDSQHRVQGFPFSWVVPGIEDPLLALDV